MSHLATERGIFLYESIFRRFDAAVGVVFNIMIKPAVAIDVVSEATLEAKLKIAVPTISLFEASQVITVKGIHYSI